MAMVDLAVQKVNGGKADLICLLDIARRQRPDLSHFAQSFSKLRHAGLVCLARGHRSTLIVGGVALTDVVLGRLIGRALGLLPQIERRSAFGARSE
jgi:hypothetical protein